MASFNKVILMGNLVRDPELRYTPKGTAVCKIGLAMNRVWYDDAGNKKEDVTFVDCDAFGKTAENISQYMKKGNPIHIEGRLKLDQWDDKQTGQKRSRIGVVVESCQFLYSASHGDGGQHQERNPPAQGGGFQQARRAAGPPPAPPADKMPPDADDDVPF